MPLTPQDKVLVFLPFPAPEDYDKKFKARFPNIPLHWELAAYDPATAKLGPLEDHDEAVWKDATILMALWPSGDQTLENIRYVQCFGAGYDAWLKNNKFLHSGIPFATTSGVQAPQIAEWVIASWLSHKHEFPRYVQAQREERWAQTAHTAIRDAHKARMGILGYGAIGRQCARLAQALGTEVYAFTSSPRPTAESRKHSGYHVPGTGDPDGTIPTKWYSGVENVNDFLAQDLDILVISLPLKPETRKLIGKSQFEILSKNKRGTFVSNIARGSVIDTEALQEALETGKVPGAAIDVTDPEPLPKGHPLWKTENLFISPHMSWASTELVSRIWDFFLDNLEKFQNGEPLYNYIQR